MRKTSTLRSAAIGLTAGFMALLAAGCAGNKQGAGARSGAAHMLGKSTETGTVTEIDRKNQVVVIDEADGDQSVVAVANHIMLGRMEVGDKVRVDCKRKLGFELLEPGESADDEEFSDDSLPAGVTFGRRLTTTVKILKIADQGESATVRGQDGAVYRLKADSKGKLAHLRPGDEVAASCTEKLSINLQR